MRQPSEIRSWLNRDELAQWVQEAPTRDVYKKRLAIWLTHIGPFHAQQVATMLQVSKQAVWLWVGQYNKVGPDGLVRQGRGGRRWSVLSWSDEEALLASFKQKAVNGQVLTAKHMWPQIQKKCGREISLAYVYGLLRRHGWRKIGPRPRHIKAEVSKQEEFKKNFQKSFTKRSKEHPGKLR